MNATYKTHAKFNLPRQIFIQPLDQLLKRVYEVQDLDLASLPQKKLEQFSKVIQEIKQDGLPKNLVVKKLSDELGYGVFLHPDAEPLTRGDVIGAYSGEVSIAPQNDPDNSAYTFAVLDGIHLLKNEHQQFDSKTKYHPSRKYALNLDAEKKGNFTRFINHSYKPNVEAEIYKVGKNNLGLDPMDVEVIYLAKKKILPGQQLLVCYEDEAESYWKPFGIKPFPMDPTTFTIDKNLKLIQKS